MIIFYGDDEDIMRMFYYENDKLMCTAFNVNDNFKWCEPFVPSWESMEQIREYSKKPNVTWMTLIHDDGEP
jgi:hypothetical protein